MQVAECLRATERRDESNEKHWFIIWYHLHTALRQGRRQAKPGNRRYAAARFCKYRLLNPAGSGTTGPCPVRFFNEPRAAFYTEKRGKKQNKNVPVCAVVRKFCQAGFPINATAIKKGWKWAQDLT
ncbi:TPA: hypothetical protein ACWX5V_004569 [Klebsiella pneumoniae]